MWGSLGAAPYPGCVGGWRWGTGWGSCLEGTEGEQTPMVRAGLSLGGG